MKKRTVSLALCAAVLSGMASPFTATAALIEPLTSPEAGFLERFLFQNDWIYQCGASSYMDQDVVSQLPGLSQWQSFVYCTDDTPNYEYAAKNNMRFPLNSIYVVDNIGSRVDIVVGDKYNTALSAEALQTIAASHYDDSFEITVTEENDRYRCIIRDPDCRAETIDTAQALCAELGETYAVFKCLYSQSVFQSHRVFSGGAYYDLNKYPDAVEELTAFAAEYAPDWTPVVFDSFVQLTPSDAETDNAANLAMAQLVYETLGYEIFIEYMNTTDTWIPLQSNLVNQINLLTTDVEFFSTYDLSLSDYTKLQSTDFLLPQDETVSDDFYYTNTFIGAATWTNYDYIFLQAPFYDTGNFIAYHSQYHVVSIGCMTAVNPDGDTTENLEALIAEYFDNTYTIEYSTAEVAPPCYHITIRDTQMRDDTYDKAYQLCAELCKSFNVNMGYSHKAGTYTALLPSSATCLDDSFASYRYTAFPNALEELTAFVAEYAPDWYIEEVSEMNENDEWVPAGVRLCPKASSATRPYGTPEEQAAMAQLVYEVLGYQVSYTLHSTYRDTLSESGVNLRNAVVADYMGDMTMDGAIDSADALTALQTYVTETLMQQNAAISSPQREIADLDSDGVITTEDVLAILSLYVSSLK